MEYLIYKMNMGAMGAVFANRYERRLENAHKKFLDASLEAENAVYIEPDLSPNQKYSTLFKVEDTKH